MRWIAKLINERSAKTTAFILKNVCYLAILFFMFGLVLSFMGRVSVTLHTGTGTYDNAIFAEEHHDWWNYSNTRGPTTALYDSVDVTVSGEFDFTVQVAIVTMYTMVVMPLIFGMWLLSRVFGYISKGQIFTEKNAVLLLYYGLIQMAASVFTPFILLGIANLANRFSSNSIFVAASHEIISKIIPSLAFIVLAYIIHYGVRLKDEVDHTL